MTARESPASRAGRSSTHRQFRPGWKVETHGGNMLRNNYHSHVFSTTIWEYLRCFFMKIRSAKPVCPHSSLQTARSFRSQSKHARTSPKCNWASTATRYGYDSYMTHITLGYDSYDMTHIHCFSNSCWMLWSTPAWCRLRAPWLELHRLWKSARAETQKKDVTVRFQRHRTWAKQCHSRW